MAGADAQSDRLPPSTRLVLFDGVCGFCDRAVHWLVERDPGQRLRFAALQGATAAALRSRHPEIPDHVDALVYIDASDGTERVYLRSEAVLRVCAALERRPRGLWLFERLPRALADLGYRLFARWRYRLFGRFDACRVPSAEQRGRYLD
jgi:predicted DCC family thiol-disulfide oxidoreductase YuxK